MGRFDQFQALSFDCFGTLIDWETGLSNAFQPWAATHRIDASAGQLVDAFAQHENVVQAETPTMLYPDVLAESLRRVASSFHADVSDEELAEFGSSVGAWPAFADSAVSLQRLAGRFKLIILSNVDRQSFAAANRRLGVHFDLVVTAQDVGAYKPSPTSFPMLIDRLGSIGIDQSQLLHVAQSLFHDHGPAQQVGLPSVWIDRRHDKAGLGATPASTAQVDWRYVSMSAFADDALGGGS